MIQVRARVKGKGPFPVDMLRYDGCYPARTEDAVKIGASFGRDPLRREILVAKETTKADAKTGVCWTPARWFSFGWSFERLAR